MTQRGFTLLELIAALGIFALMSVMAYAGLASVLDSRQVIVAQLDRTADLQRAVHRLTMDIQQARLRGIRDEFGDAQPPFSMGLSGRVEFTSGGWSNPLGQTRSTLQRVAYELRDESLVRYAWPTLDRVQNSQPLQTPILSNVTDMEWRFLDDSRKWHDQWPPASTNVTNPGALTAAPTLPVVAELTLETKYWQELRFRFLVKAR